MENGVLGQRVEQLAGRLEKVEERQDKLEDAHAKHREEFIETRTYVKESYTQLKEIRLGIDALNRQTGERIEQQGKFYREELNKVQDQLRGLEKQQAAQPAGDGGESKRTYDFAWKVVAGILGLATGILAILQATGGTSP